jgi:hypothetical protein
MRRTVEERARVDDSMATSVFSLNHSPEEFR